MKAVLCREWGGPDSLRFEDAARRKLRTGEVRIRVHASGVNFADTLMIAGKYQIKPEFPFTPAVIIRGFDLFAGDRAGIGKFAKISALFGHGASSC